MKCPVCGSTNLEEKDYLVYHTDGNDYKCLDCDCEFGVYNFGKHDIRGTD